MATTIVHFGFDECVRLLVLSRAGYQVDACGRSITEFQKRLVQGHTDAIAISCEGLQSVDKVAETARRLSLAPLILFEGRHCHLEPSQFDLVISPGIGPAEWLAKIQELLEYNRRLQEDSRSIQAQSAALREASVQAREQSARERDRTVLLRDKARKRE